MTDPIKVVIIEDDAIIAMNLQSDLEANGYRVAGIAHKSEKALDLIHSQRPDLALLDIHLNGAIDGIDLAEIINDKYQIPFLFITAFSDLDTLKKAKVTSPCGYIVKPYKAADLIANIEVGLYNYNMRKKDQEMTLESANQKVELPLTAREFILLKDLMEGLTNAQIAEKESISINTVKWHLQKLYSKVGVKNRTSALKIFME